MKIGDIVTVVNSAYSMSLIKGEMQHRPGVATGRRFRVHDVDGNYPTDRVHDGTGTNGVLLVDTINPDFVLFTQERFCKVKDSATVKAPVVKETPKSSYEVETGCIEISDLLQGVARTHGWDVWSGMKQGGTYPYFLIYPNAGRVDWNNNSHLQYQELSIPAAITLLKESIVPPRGRSIQKIKIADHRVLFLRDGNIKVGCEVISLKTIDAIHTHAHAISKAAVQK